MGERPAFIDQLRANWDQGKSVCVGLDADYDKLPPHLKAPNGYDRPGFAQQRFMERIVDATADLVCAYKPNLAFFEDHPVFADHPDGEEALAAVVDYIHSNYPTVPVIADAKRGDIANTNRGYARSLFKRFGFDATTVHSYLGASTYPPFLAYPGKGIIAMCKTSNPDAPANQDLVVDMPRSVDNGSLTPQEYEAIKGATEVDTVPFYWIVAYRHGVLRKDNPNIGIVVGATHAQSFIPVRRLYGDGPILIPGIGTQSGDLAATLRYAPDSQGEGMIINSASGIIFASSGRDFADAARTATLSLHNQITRLRES